MSDTDNNALPTPLVGPWSSALQNITAALQPRQAAFRQPVPPQPPDQGNQITRGPRPGTPLPPERPLDIRPPAQQETTEPTRIAQAYTPHRPVNYEDWGDDPWVAEAIKHNPELSYTSHATTPREAYSTAYGASKALADNSAPGVAGPARIAASIAGMIAPVMDYVGGGAFSPAFGKSYGTLMKGRMDEMKMRREYFEMQRERMLDAIDDAYLAQKHMATDYQQVFKLLKLDLIKPEEARKRVYDLNTQYRHGELQRRLDSGDLEAVEKYIEWEKAKANDDYISSQSLRASDRRRKESAGADPDSASLNTEWSRSRSSRGTTESGDPYLPKKGDEEKEKADMPEEGTFDNHAAKKYDLSNSGLSLMHELMRTGELPDKMTAADIHKRNGDEYRSRAESAAAEGESAMDKIRRADPAKYSPEEKLEAYRKIDPEIADAARDLADYGRELKDMPKKKQDLYARLAKSLNPNFSKDNYNIVKNMQKQDSKEFQTIVRFSGAAQHLTQIFGQLKDRDESASIPGNKINEWIQGNVTGETQYPTLARQMYEWAQVLNSIQTLQGSPRVTLTTHLNSLIGASASPRQIRDAMKQDLNDAWSHYTPYQGLWNGTGKKGLVPGMREDEMNILSAYMRMNPNTGQMPSDAPPQAMAVSKDPSKAHRKLTDEQKRAPYTSEDMRDIKKEIGVVKERLRVTPGDASLQFKLDTLIHANGLVINGPWELGY